ncbi:hypothetical protein V8F20_002843 [Naviculisporaceae sp. PSN 640]
MEALAAVGLSCNILQFVELTAKLVTTTRQISDQGAKQENIEIQAIAQLLRSLAERIQQQHSGAYIDDDLRSLCQACLSITDELLPVLDSLRAGDNTTTWQSFQQGLRAMRRTGKIEVLQKRLDRIGKALHDYMLVSQQDKMAEQLDRLAGENWRLEAERTKDIEALRKDLQIAFADLRTSFNRSREEREDEIPMAALLALARTEAQYSAEQFILDSLRFPGIDERYAGVQAAHKRTFTWVFEGDERRNGMSLPSFGDWLSSGDDLYWISGKPGSGKSTLMKFLCEQNETEWRLRQWAGSNPLITANFFFWSAAKRSILKSQEGLLRSLTYQVFRQRPEMISRVYPEVEQRQTQTSSGEPGTYIPRNTSLRKPATDLPGLLSTLRKMCQEFSSTNTRMCFFIDGLDEYEGRPGDIIELIEILRSLPNFKLCISSRPWNEFEHRFGQERPHKLYMELCNRGDIEKYVYDTFTSDRNTWAFTTGSKQGAQLVGEIIDNSQGVFLWVVLVVKSFCEGLINGDRIEDLRDRLRMLPTDLNVYFEKILLGDVEPFYRSQASRMFQVAVAAHSRLPLAAFWFIGTGRDDPGFDPQLQPMRLEEVEARYQQLRKIINALIDFLHRTVKDFLVTPETQTTLISWDQGQFKPDLAICHALLACLRTMPEVGFHKWPNHLTHVMHPFFSHCRRVNNDLDCAREELQKLIDRFHDRLLRIYSPEGLWKEYMSLVSGMDYPGYFEQLHNLPRLQLHSVCVIFGLSRYLPQQFDSPSKRESYGTYLGLFLRQATAMPNNEDLVRKLLDCGLSPDDPVVHEMGPHMAKSSWVLLVHDIWNKGVDRYRFQLVQILLEHGVSDPNAMVWEEGMTCQEILRMRLPPEYMALIEQYFKKSNWFKEVPERLGSAISSAINDIARAVKDCVDSVGHCFGSIIEDVVLVSIDAHDLDGIYQIRGRLIQQAAQPTAGGGLRDRSGLGKRGEGGEGGDECDEMHCGDDGE